MRVLESYLLTFVMLVYCGVANGFIPRKGLITANNLFLKCSRKYSHGSIPNGIQFLVYMERDNLIFSFCMFVCIIF